MVYSDKKAGSPIHKLWAAISMVGGACERRVWARVGDYITYPNLYILLVAPPGVGKSIINDVKELWNEAVEPSGGPAFHVASDSVTRASLVDELNEASSTRLVNASHYTYHSILLPAEEFEEFLPFYDSHTISLLNSLWNNKAYHRESRRHGPARSIDIRNPSLHILGGVQPAYFVAHFPPEAWTTGLARRIIMVYADVPPLRSLFDQTPNRDVIKHHILMRLGHITELYGEVKWADSAPHELDKWHLAGGPPTPNHSKLKSYNTTRTEFLTKLSIVSAVSRTGELIVEETDLKRAMSWLFEAEKRMPDIFRAMIGKSDSQIIEDLHYYVNMQWAVKKEGVRNALVHMFLSQRVPSEKIHNIIMTAEKSGVIMKSPSNIDLWLPRPKHLHGVE